MNAKKKNNVIIGSLCAVLLLMVVGYAAFSTVLNINGTANISSTWNVLITNVQEGTITGSAKTTLYTEGDKAGQKIMEYEALTATFSADLETPGDSIEYIITVTNRGTLNAKLDKINITDSNNEMIVFESSGLVVNDTLAPNESKDLNVKVIYKNVAEGQGQATNKIGTIKVTLDFSQATGTVAPTNKVVYRWGSDELKVGDSIEGIQTTTDPTTLGENHYLKHEIDSENKITASYLCFVSDTEHCLQDGSVENYEANKNLLLGQNDWFNINGDGCSDNESRDYTYSVCDGGGFNRIIAFSIGGVTITSSNNHRCEIQVDGISYCSASV